MKIAFCKFAAFANGGTEKYLQSISILYKSIGRDVDFFYTNAAPTIGSSFICPDNNTDRMNLVKSKGINLFKVHVGNRYVSPYPYEVKWIDTDFFDVFKESDYEYLITAGDGRKEFPYADMHNIKIINTVHGFHAYNQPNIVQSVLLCKWQADKWIKNGGDSSRAEIIPTLVTVPATWTKTFREKNGIPADAFVYGLHQGKGVGSLVSLQAFSSLVKSNCYCAFLGGSEIHRQYCRDNNIKNVIFVDATSSVNDIHDFLDGIDVFAHCRVDGEVCSAAIIESMYHEKPIISYIGDGTNLGHVEQIKGCGTMTHSVEEYAQEMIKLQDKNYYSDMSGRIRDKYRAVYDSKIVEKKLLQLIDRK